MGRPFLEPPQAARRATSRLCSRTPLEPGDYQIVLRATTPDNLAATSLETAIVTVPDDEAGQVLALVDQPGAPSRLITVPEAKAPQEGESETQAEVATEPSATAPTGQGQPATAEKTAGRAGSGRHRGRRRKAGRGRAGGGTVTASHHSGGSRRFPLYRGGRD